MISQKAKYALRALVALCKAPPESSLMISEISRAQQIPKKFLEQIERLALTRPGQDPTRLAPPLQDAPPLQPGVWQLRPMVSRGGPTFDVLSGPVIFVG